MLQILDLEKNKLFSEISSEESASVSGGGLESFGLASILAIATGIFTDPVVQAMLLFTAINPSLE
ncbi:MAG: hypothetical protein RMY36_012230 [Nostoc sp. SerVER01]|uniref:hypothetical protein n=1 Tax=Nostoc sp. CCY 9925 TaxID=3103865 RepID=UPI002ADC2E75|nr:hypothetical protein [Nostoc sp. SerVER01]MDZ8027494.1 hypothetical protein [Nostoc sp. DedQUE11]MDZ8072686.1 hypothetical protein [Nostoc sp. DedQUE01]MDZ8079640.1 hypothetical protein [Nostoc sp. DcaGUA01]MDZ8235577.1 hypothetical protein [Nostoc sp. ChiQUE01a]